MPNIQIIDGAENCSYEIYSVDKEVFKLIFPAEGQDVEFVEDFMRRTGEVVAEAVIGKLWMKPVDKKKARGIHGTLFYELERKKIFYPTKKESEMTVAKWLSGKKNNLRS